MAIGTMGALGVMAGGEALAQLIGAGAKIDRLTPEQKATLKELERKEALGMLGLTAGEQQNILNQQLQPVRAQQRESMGRLLSTQQVGDIGQGAAFRQQQALQEAQSQATAQATQDAMSQMAELDALAEARELARLRSLKGQQQRNKDAIASMLGAVPKAVGRAGEMAFAIAEKKEREQQMLDALSQVAKDNNTESADDEYTKSFMQSLMGLTDEEQKENMQALYGTSSPEKKSEYNPLLGLIRPTEEEDMQSIESFFTSEQEPQPIIEEPITQQPITRNAEYNWLDKPEESKKRNTKISYEIVPLMNSIDGNYTAKRVYIGDYLERIEILKDGIPTGKKYFNPKTYKTEQNVDDWDLLRDYIIAAQGDL